MYLQVKGFIPVGNSMSQCVSTNKTILFFVLILKLINKILVNITCGLITNSYQRNCHVRTQNTVLDKPNTFNINTITK